MTDGIILVDKQAGLTSFQTLGAIKARLGTRKVGHAGTLDKFADGLLVVLTGRMTRLCPVASGMDKEYIARIRFGVGTDTLDPEGAVVAEGPVPQRHEIEAIAAGFIGTICQTPPAFSAVHIGGRRAYQDARKGLPVDVPSRQVTIHSIDILDFKGPEAVVRVACSKGTYIRALARDLAARAGTCAHLSGLRRIRIGGLRVDEAVRPADFDPGLHLLPARILFEASPHLGLATINDWFRDRIASGVQPTLGSFENPPRADSTFGAFDREGSLLALCERRGDRVNLLAVLAEAGRS